MVLTKFPVDLGQIELHAAGWQHFDALRELYALRETLQYQLYNAAQLRQALLQSAEHEDALPGIPCVLAIVLRQPRSVIGELTLTVTSPEDGQAELGVSLHPDHWGKGHATVAMRALVDICFRTTRLHRIVAATDTRNTRCWRLLERIGMRREAHFRHEYFLDDRWVDSFVYAIIEDDWRLRVGAEKRGYDTPDCPNQ